MVKSNRISFQRLLEVLQKVFSFLLLDPIIDLKSNHKTLWLLPPRDGVYFPIPRIHQFDQNNAETWDCANSDQERLAVFSLTTPGNTTVTTK